MDQPFHRTPLRQRLTESARGLARSSISSVAGIEAELRGSAGLAGKQQVPGGVRSPEAIGAQQTRQERAWGHRAEGAGPSFRTAPDEAMTQTTEAEYDQFWQGPSIWAGNTGLDTWDGQDTSRGREQPVFDHQGRPQQGHVAADEPLTKGKKPMSVDVDAIEPDYRSDGRTMSPVPLSVATARLEQVQQHLSKTTMTTRQDRRFGRPLPFHEHHTARGGQSNDHRPQFQHPAVLATPTHGATPNTPADDEPRVAEFHCPYVACHHNLAMHNQQLSPSEQRRRCVHAGCSYVSDTIPDWIEHTLAPHHDLQRPSPVTDIPGIDDDADR